ncbi:MAG: hypothetical protein WCN92_03290 [Eubacteriales bacterium]
MDNDTLFDKVLNVFKHKKNDSPDETPELEAAAAAPVVLGTPLPVTKSEGELMLIKTDDPTAAVIMAIISNQSKIALNRLSFKSIKLLEDKQ